MRVQPTKRPRSLMPVLVVTALVFLVVGVLVGLGVGIDVGASYPQSDQWSGPLTWIGGCLAFIATLLLLIVAAGRNRAEGPR
jgi:hypothetical protein